jgi:hypothetical protein
MAATGGECTACGGFVFGCPTLTMKAAERLPSEKCYAKKNMPEIYEE